MSNKIRQNKACRFLLWFVPHSFARQVVDKNPKMLSWGCGRLRTIFYLCSRVPLPARALARTELFGGDRVTCVGSELASLPTHLTLSPAQKGQVKNRLVCAQCYTALGMIFFLFSLRLERARRARAARKWRGFVRIKPVRIKFVRFL